MYPSRLGIGAPLRVVDSCPQSTRRRNAVTATSSRLLEHSRRSREDAHLGPFRSESTSAWRAMASVSTQALETPPVDDKQAWWAPSPAPVNTRRGSARTNDVWASR